MLAELAAFDELLRKPLDPEPPPGPPVPPPAPQASASARRVPPMPQPAAEPPRKPAEPERPPLEPVSSLQVDDWLTEPEDEEIDLRSREVDALRARVAAEPPSARRSRASVLSIAALGAGIVAGGPLGWWLAVNLFVSTPPLENVEHEPAAASVPAATPPGASRSATRRAPSKPAAPGATAVTRKDASALSTVAAPMASSPPPAGAAAIPSIPSTPIVPAPSMDLPLTSVPPPAPLTAKPLTAAPLPGATSSSAVLPSAPTSLAAAATLAVVTADRAAIERTLRQYKDAYERLDARAAMAVWPTVDQRALSRAFAGLASQSLDFRGCEVAVRPGAITATASCNGTAEYVRKVGDTRLRVEPRQWTFTLNKTQGAWTIEAVDGSR